MSSIDSSKRCHISKYLEVAELTPSGRAKLEEEEIELWSSSIVNFYIGYVFLSLSYTQRDQKV